MKGRGVEEAIGETCSRQEQGKAQSLHENTRNDNRAHRTSQSTRRRGGSQGATDKGEFLSWMQRRPSQHHPGCGGSAWTSGRSPPGLALGVRLPFCGEKAQGLTPPACGTSCFVSQRAESCLTFHGRWRGLSRQAAVSGRLSHCLKGRWDTENPWVSCWKYDQF